MHILNDSMQNAYGCGAAARGVSGVHRGPTATSSVGATEPPRLRQAALQTRRHLAVPGHRHEMNAVERAALATGEMPVSETGVPFMKRSDSG
jgi:hypothetical protein